MRKNPAEKVDIATLFKQRVSGRLSGLCTVPGIFLRSLPDGIEENSNARAYFVYKTSHGFVAAAPIIADSLRRFKEGDFDIPVVHGRIRNFRIPSPHPRDNLYACAYFKLQRYLDG